MADETGEGDGLVPPDSVAEETPPLKPPPLLFPPFVAMVAALAGVFIGGCFTGMFFFAGAVHAATEAAGGGGGGGVGAAPSPPPNVALYLMQAPGFVTAAVAVTQLALFLAVWKVPRWMKDVGAQGWWERVAWRPERFSVVQALLTTVGMIFFGSLAMHLINLTRSSGGMLEQLHSGARAGDASSFAWFVLAAAIAPGFVEEVAFRGLLQTRLVERWGVVAGIAVSALTFGVWHLDLRQGLGAIVLGAWLGWCSYRQRTVVNGSIAHMLNNGVVFVIARVGAGGLGGTTTAAWGTMAIEGAIGAACAAAVWWLTRGDPPEPQRAIGGGGGV